MHDELAVTGKACVEPETGSGAFGVGNDCRSLDDIGLLEIVVGHRNAAFGKPSGQCDDQLGVAAHVDTQRFGNSLAGQVVFGGPEATHDADEIDARECCADGADEVAPTVAGDGFEVDGDTDLIELFGQVERIGVLPEGR